MTLTHNRFSSSHTCKYPPPGPSFNIAHYINVQWVFFLVISAPFVQVEARCYFCFKPFVVEMSVFCIVQAPSARWIVGNQNTHDNKYIPFWHVGY